MSHSFIVPLGPTTAVRHQMGEKYNSKREFLFFDPLTTSFSSVIDVIKADDIRQIVNKETFTIAEIKAPHYVTISFKGTDCLKNSIDIRPANAREDTRTFLAKMYYRYKRLMFYITQNIYPLTFLYAGPVTNEEAQEFLAAIRRHNERCKVRLVSAHGDEDEIDTGVDRFSRIRLEQFWEGTTPKELVTMDNYNWGYVWDKIDELDIAEKPQTAPSSATYTIPDISGEADLSGDAISYSS